MQLSRIMLFLGLRLHHGLLSLIDMQSSLVHMSLIFAATIVTSETLSAHTTNEGPALLIVLLVCDVYERLRIRVRCSIILIVSVFLLATRVDNVRVRIVEASLGAVYHVAVGTSCTIVLSVRALVLGLLRALRRPCKGTHCIREFALSLGDDLQ